ncbi:MAG: hypothetical protein LBB89_11230 [Treponema sp.]|jgi:hypothetical protein|nr:hypothetical protein [Treponema sp.]
MDLTPHKCYAPILIIYSFGYQVTSFFENETDKTWQKMAASRGLRSPRLGNKGIGIRRRVCVSSPALLNMAGALPVIRKGFTRKAAGTKYGRYQGAALHFFRRVLKRELAGFHFACGVFRMGIKAAVKDFLTRHHQPVAGSAERSAAVPACLAMPEAVTPSQAVRPSTALV